jgi:ParB-like chromosome segregation protein Spo0J
LLAYHQRTFSLTLKGKKLEIESVELITLRLDPENARRHSARNIEVIANSLREFGQRKPIVVSGANVIVAGNGTYEAAKSLGWNLLDIVRVPEEWSPEQIMAYALVDNRSAELAEWDNAILASQLRSLEDFFDYQEFGFNPLSQEVETAPEDFPEFKEDAETAYRCPKCSYEWNGKAR